MSNQRSLISSSPILENLVPFQWCVSMLVCLVLVVYVGQGPQAFSESPPAIQGKQGEVLLVSVPVTGQPKQVRGTFLQRPVLFYPVNEGSYEALLGVDLQAKTGVHELLIDVTYPDTTTHQGIRIQVMKETYPVQQLSLPDKMVDLDKKTLNRVREETSRVNEAFASLDPRRLWAGTFVEPVQGRVSGRFGSRRVINGQPKKPHSGEDIAAPAGTPVLAMNEGIVRLTMDHFFTGKGVILDHGLGLFSMYFHLSAIDVQDGQLVTTGQRLGKVGSSGRATGPHLHWGVRLNGARVNPYSLIQVTQTAEVTPSS